MKNKLSSWYAPAILAVLIFTSNFLNTKIFDFDDNNFAVWFVLSFFCFACGWMINKTLNWKWGGKVLFAITITTSVFSLIFIVFFSEYFSANNLVTENLILYTLRNVTLGAMGFFGMAVEQVFRLQEEVESSNSRLEGIKERGTEEKLETSLLIKEAAIKAKKIITEAELEAQKIIQNRERVEKELKELIRTEKELIKKYENLDN
ncbi:MAG: hypothetical protein GX452_01380 [Ignavibacteriales bacterium]|jgi:hypothetical protein|nr:hypothetical protein [Ignavibacteriaceae bacterium]NLH60039.1 hypothetical protein [Ignavibacteriales bacterium]HOJ18510.1 hypothetical protein [Ignavibacteriaceae bacterium]HPO56588.1 hypothetical protein [Ignavibacteriaceae bacterium]